MESLKVGAIVMGLVGGLALFLYGMEKLTDALKLIAGDRAKRLLARMTSNRFKSVFTGAAITAVIQSSSVTTVLVVGFISAGLLSFPQSIGVIMGASIGTTVTAQIIAFNVTQYALILVAAGFALSFLSRSPRLRRVGGLVMGLGLIFFGMHLMKEATSPLRDFAPFIAAMRDLRSPLVAVLFSALFTALVQSSSATTGVIIVLASQGFLTLEAGIALVLGANIGTCVTAFLAAIGKPRESVRAATVHIVFNTVGVLIWINLIGELAEVVRWLSPAAEGLEGVARLQAETPRQIANSHTVFNVANTALFIGFTPLLARLVEWLVPEPAAGRASLVGSRYLDEIVDQAPGLALDLLRREFTRLGDLARAMVRQAIDPVLTGGEDEIERLHLMDEEVDRLHEVLVTHLGRLSAGDLTDEQSRLLARYLAAGNYFENIGDMVETNLVDAARERLARDLEISPTTREVLRGLHEKVLWAVEEAARATAEDDVESARRVIAAKKQIQDLAAAAETHLARRLTAPAPNRMAVFRIESELVEALKRTYYFAKRIARLVVEAAD